MQAIREGLDRRMRKRCRQHKRVSLREVWEGDECSICRDVLVEPDEEEHEGRALDSDDATVDGKTTMLAQKQTRTKTQRKIRMRMKQKSWYDARGAVDKTFTADVWKSGSKRRRPARFVEKIG